MGDAAGGPAVPREPGEHLAAALLGDRTEKERPITPKLLNGGVPLAANRRANVALLATDNNEPNNECRASQEGSLEECLKFFEAFHNQNVAAKQNRRASFAAPLQSPESSRPAPPDLS